INSRATRYSRASPTTSLGGLTSLDSDRPTFKAFLRYSGFDLFRSAKLVLSPHSSEAKNNFLMIFLEPLGKLNFHPDRGGRYKLPGSPKFFFGWSRFFWKDCMLF